MDLQFEIFLKLLEITDFNQSQLGRRIGKPASRINEWKNGKHLPSFNQLLLMADKLGYSLYVELVKNKE